MREIFTYGFVGRASGNRCLYPEGRPGVLAAFLKCLVFEKLGFDNLPGNMPRAAELPVKVRHDVA